MDIFGKNILLVLAIAMISLTACSSGTETAADTNNDMMDDSKLTGNTVTFDLTGEDFAFFMNGKEAPELKVKQGDKVIIKFTSTQGFHDWVVDEFGAATEKVQTGGSTSVEFIASEKGIFEYYCSLGQHRANGMKGNLIVE